MSKSQGILPADEVARLFELDLRNRGLAALLAWLWPGAGHLYQGRTAKGLLFMLCIVSTFVFGFYLGEGKVAYATPLTLQEINENTPAPVSLRGRLMKGVRSRLTQAIDRWPFLCQAGIGAVAIPAVIERQSYLTNIDPHWPGDLFYPPKMKPTEPLEFQKKDEAGNMVDHPSELAQWNYDLGFRFELGTIYTVIAGLLNILAVYDAYSGPLVPKPVLPEEEDPGENDNSEPNENKS